MVEALTLAILGAIIGLIIGVIGGQPVTKHWSTAAPILGHDRFGTKAQGAGHSASRVAATQRPVVPVASAPVSAVMPRCRG